MSEDEENYQVGDIETIPNKFQVGTRVESKSGEIHWLPIVDVSFKPIKGTIFNSIDDAFKFYKEYAYHGGFEVRKSTQTPVSKQRLNDGQRIIKLKYLVCSREGFKTKKAEGSPLDNTNTVSLVRNDNGCTREINNVNSNVDVNEGAAPKTTNKQKRRRPSQRTGCEASIKLQITHDNKYELYHFEEAHNHCLVHPDYMHHLKSNRRLTSSMKTILHTFFEAGIGPTSAHRILTKMYGGHDKVGVTLTDIRNYKRDVNAYIGEADAQMVVDMLQKKKECLPNFSFDYFTGEDSRLGGLFWADEQAKQNYSAFGDVVSFDATFRSNKYKMVFVPFTGIDNHKRCVTFGAALLTKEDAVSYTWLLTQFKKAFPREPKIVLTDQCPSMKIAVKEVFISARHRLCMWHIMEKLSKKVNKCRSIEGLKAHLSRIVWTDKLEPVDFETLWASVINHYNLQDHDWLGTMYGMRMNWIPAYFRDWSMSGLMRTSSRSESENHMFQQLMSGTSTLVEFFWHFETAMQSQRNVQSRNDEETFYTTPDVILDTPLEKDALKIYTRSVFYDVQKDIKAASKYCMSLTVNDINGVKSYTIVDASVKSTNIDDQINRVENPMYFDELIPTQSQVVFVQEEHDISCSCKKFERFGLLCRHIFYVLRICQVTEIPKKYICRRWTPDAVPFKTSLSGLRPMQPEGNTTLASELMKEIYYDIDYCLNKVRLDSEKLTMYRDSIKEIRGNLELMESQPSTGSKSNEKSKSFVAQMVGLPQPENILVHPPKDNVNKGGGKRTRITSVREEAIIQSNKPLRRCAFCKIKTDHDIRTCKYRKAHEAALAAAAEILEDASSEESEI